MTTSTSRQGSRAVSERWLVWDATGTLIVPRRSIAEVYAEVHASTVGGLTPALTADEIRPRIAKAIAVGFEQHAASTHRAVTDEANERRRWKQIVSEVFPSLDAKRLDTAFESLWEYFSQPDAWCAAPDSQRVLATCRAMGYRSVIGSNFDDRLRRVVGGLPELSSIERIFTSAELGYSKPDVRFFRAIETRLQVGQSRLSMIGDDPTNDLHGAQGAGWRSLLIPTNAGISSALPWLHTHPSH
jgi:putative hydrolase of the HAD superfamily